MRVLHLNSGNLYGGIETLLTCLAGDRSSCPDLAPEFGLCFEGRSSEELRRSGAPLHMLFAARVSRPWTIWQARRIFDRLLLEREYDLVVCHGSWTHALFGPVVRRRGVPLVFWAHGPIAGSHWLDRWAGRTRPDLVIVNSHWTKQNVRLFSGVPSEVVYPPVADVGTSEGTFERRMIRAELGTVDDTVVIVQASRLEAWKGQTLLLDALACLSNRPGWECWIAGGPQRPEEESFLRSLRAQAAAGGIASRVKFLGQRSDVPRLLAGADIHCQANLSPEPFGIAFIEAMRAGLPVVGTTLGGPMEIITETCGRLVTPGDAPSLAATLLSLIDDRALRERLGRGGAERAQVISDPAARLVQLAALFAHLLARAGARRIRAVEETLCKQ